MLIVLSLNDKFWVILFLYVYSCLSYMDKKKNIIKWIKKCAMWNKPKIINPQLFPQWALGPFPFSLTKWISGRRGWKPLAPINKSLIPPFKRSLCNWPNTVSLKSSAQRRISVYFYWITSVSAFNLELQAACPKGFTWRARDPKHAWGWACLPGLEGFSHGGSPRFETASTSLASAIVETIESWVCKRKILRLHNKSLIVNSISKGSQGQRGYPSVTLTF